MLAALLCNLEAHVPDAVMPEGFYKKHHDELFRKAKETLERKRSDQGRLRAHLEEAFTRLRQKPESKAKVEQIITVEAPDFRIIVRNELIVAQLQALYLEYLDDEEILILAMSVI